MFDLGYNNKKGHAFEWAWPFTYCLQFQSEQIFGLRLDTSYQFHIKALSALARHWLLNVLSVRLRRRYPRRLDIIFDLKSILSRLGTQSGSYIEVDVDDDGKLFPLGKSQNFEELFIDEKA